MMVAREKEGLNQSVANNKQLSESLRFNTLNSFVDFFDFHNDLCCLGILERSSAVFFYDCNEQNKGDSNLRVEKYW